MNSQEAGVVGVRARLKILAVGVALAVFGGAVGAQPAAAGNAAPGTPASGKSACIDLRETGTFTATGALTHTAFTDAAGRLEPAFIIKLDRPICVTGDEFRGRIDGIDRVHVYPDPKQPARTRELSNSLRRLAGQRVSAVGKSPFGAITAHHHAPLVLPVTQVFRVAGR